MSTQRSRTSERLLIPSQRLEESEPKDCGTVCYKGSTLIFSVLFVCGVLALIVSVFIWQFLDLEDEVICNKRIVGYYTGWESMEISRRQLLKLTHVVFAYLGVNQDGSIYFNSELAKQRYWHMKNKTRSLKSKAKVMVSIGGTENSKNFSFVLADVERRKTFIQSILDFLAEYRAYGVDLSWKWPEEKDKWNYVLFLKDLRKELKNQNTNYVLSIVVPPIDVGDWELGFEMEEILLNVDFVNINSMDYYGAWGDQWGTPTGPSAPLYFGLEQRKTFNVYWTLKYYVCKYERPGMYNIAIPFYGSVWKNVEDPINLNYEVWRNVEFVDGKPDGKAYMSRRTMEQDGWVTKPSSWDDQTQSSYIWNQENRTFLAFENERSIEAKTDFVTDMNLGGVWIWSLDMDDDRISLLSSVATHKYCFNSKKENSVMYKC